MARPVTDPQVRMLIPNTTITDLTTPFISCANARIDVLAASSCGTSLTETELECIELYYAAHLAAQTDPSLAIVSEKVEGSTVVASRGNVANQSGLMSTHFGQTANSLSGGCLQELELRKPTLAFA